LGDPSGLTVVFHHGTPGSVKLVNYFEKIADQSSLFFVTFSRAGYGLSSRLEGRTISSVVADVTTVLDVLGREDYVAVGWSGGGPHALACAALDAPRCLAAWSLAGVVPLDAGIDWTEGMGPENLEEFSLALEGGSEYEAHVMRPRSTRWRSSNTRHVSSSLRRALTRSCRVTSVSLTMTVRSFSPGDLIPPR